LTRSAPLAFDTAASPLPVRPGARAIAHIKFTMSDRWNRSRDGTERFRSGFEFGSPQADVGSRNTTLPPLYASGFTRVTMYPADLDRVVMLGAPGSRFHHVQNKEMIDSPRTLEATSV
ncbi:MAG: hypothetical protein J4N65_11445, partial [Chloroflexi bacterium]|nr:hypothetical protein [Chloroflexota bacterium]